MEQIFCYQSSPPLSLPMQYVVVDDEVAFFGGEAPSFLLMLGKDAIDFEFRQLQILYGVELQVRGSQAQSLLWECLL